MKLKTDQDELKPEEKSFLKSTTLQSPSTASAKLFKQKQLQALQTGDTEETAIVLLGDSDDDIDLSINDATIGIMVSFVSFIISLYFLDPRFFPLFAKILCPKSSGC